MWFLPLYYTHLGVLTLFGFETFCDVPDLLPPPHTLPACLLPPYCPSLYYPQLD